MLFGRIPSSYSKEIINPRLPRLKNFFQLITFAVLSYLQTSSPGVYCTAILYLAFPGFFERITSYLNLLFCCNSQEKQILKESLTRKSHCVMIRGEFRNLSIINYGAKNRYLF